MLMSLDALLGISKFKANVVHHSFKASQRYFILGKWEVTFAVMMMFQPPAIDPWDRNSQYAPIPDNWGRSPATLFSLSPSPHRTLQPRQPDQLGFLAWAEWEDGGKSEEQPPKYICYIIAWKLILNRKTAGRMITGRSP